MNKAGWWVAGIALVVLYEMRRRANLRAYERAIAASYSVGRTAAPECNCARTAPTVTTLQPIAPAPITVRAPAFNIGSL
jgi:hypothetical protein